MSQEPFDNDNGVPFPQPVSNVEAQQSPDPRPIPGSPAWLNVPIGAPEPSWLGTPSDIPVPSFLKQGPLAKP